MSRVSSTAVASARMPISVGPMQTVAASRSSWVRSTAVDLVRRYHHQIGVTIRENLEFVARVYNLPKPRQAAVERNRLAAITR